MFHKDDDPGRDVKQVRALALQLDTVGADSRFEDEDQIKDWY